MVFGLPIEENLSIEKLVYGGDGLTRQDGRVILVPFVLPGETVRTEVQPSGRDLWRGRLLEVLTPSRMRVTPGCPYFLRCGGCQYQHIGYAHQLDSKCAILREVLRRVGKLDYDGGIGVIAGEPWQYRNRVQLHIENGAVGYYEHGSHRLCVVDRCPVSSPALNAAIAKLAAELPHYRGFQSTVELFTDESVMQVNVLDRVPAPLRPLFDSLGTPAAIEYAGFRVSRNSFFQVNRFLIDRLVDCATTGLSGETAADLYAGVGLFTVRLAPSFGKVTAVESSRSAFRDLEFNIQQRGLRVAAENRPVEEFLGSLEHAPDLILADPPRAGLGKQTVRELLRLHPRNIVIVACDPATLARDLRALLGGGYRIDQIAMVDLFPQTSHIETVVRLVQHSVNAP